jgi:hypothetical protein
LRKCLWNPRSAGKIPAKIVLTWGVYCDIEKMSANGVMLEVSVY